MRELLPDGAPLPSADALSDAFAQTLRDGISIVDDCLLLGKSDAVPRLNAVRGAVMDKTGYECFVNHVHTEQRGEAAAVLGQVVAFCTHMSAEAIRIAPNRSLRFVISKNGKDWAVHFHTLSHESWVSNDLEGYTEEAVLVLDSTEL